MRTPYEVFYKKPHHHIPAKVFGCLSYTHNYLRTKKQMNRTRRAIFLGIDSSGRYKFQELGTNIRYTNDSAEFYEDIFPLGKHKHLYNISNNNGVPTIPELEFLAVKNSGQIFLLDDGLEKEPEHSMEPHVNSGGQETKTDFTQKNGVQQSSRSSPHIHGSNPFVSDLPDQERTQLEETKHDLSLEDDHFQQEECISDENSTARYPTRQRQISQKGLESLANTPPKTHNTHGTGRISTREIEALANSPFTINLSLHHTTKQS